MGLRRVRRWVTGCIVAPVLLSVGCGDEDTAKAIDSFQKASGALAASYEAFLQGANEVEEEDAVNDLVIRRAAFDEKAVAGRHLYSPEQIALRGKAIKAVAAYTATLAELAAGKEAKQVAADATAASGKVSTLATDAQKVTGVDSFAGPVSTAMGAAANVLGLVVERKARAAVRTSVMANDEAVGKLFETMERESEELYQRQKQTLGLEEDAVIRAFNAEASRGQAADGAKLLELGERFKRVNRRVALQSKTDPEPAIKAFQKAHDALIAAVKGGEAGKKQTVAGLIAEAKGLADEVEPLAVNLQAFVASF